MPAVPGAATVPGPAAVPGAAGGTWPDLLNLGFQVINVNSRKCLVAGGDGLAQDNCGRGDAYRWRFRPVSLTGAFEIVHHRSGRCLSVRGDAPVLAGCAGGNADRWQLLDSDGPTAQMRNTAAGRCLTVAAGAVTDGAAAVLDACDDRRSRRWTVRLLRGLGLA